MKNVFYPPYALKIQFIELTHKASLKTIKILATFKLYNTVKSKL